MKDSLDTALKQLRLSGMLQTLEVRLQEASGNHLTHTEFLELILQDELTVRQDRLIQRRVKAAGFREMRTLEDFDWQFSSTFAVFSPVRMEYYAYQKIGLLPMIADRLRPAIRKGVR